jgi:hypothetical protein
VPKRRDKSEPPGSSTLGTIMLLMAAVFAAFPEGRNWPVVAAIAGLGFLFTFIGSGRIYRPAVTTTADAILCRFDLWRDASFYFVLFGLPLAAAIGLLGGDFLGRFSPNFWRFLGIVMLSLWIRFLFIFVRQGRQSWLRISPMALTVHQPGQQTAATEIPRGAVEAIAATTAKMRNYDNAPTTQITYSGGDQSPAAIGSVLFGPTNTKKTAWLTVEQSDLLGGLQAWKDGDPNDPGLMDRVEAILRGQAAKSL